MTNMDKEEAMEILGRLMLSGKIHKLSKVISTEMQTKFRLLLHWVSTDQGITEGIEKEIRELEADIESEIFWPSPFGTTVSVSSVSGTAGKPIVFGPGKVLQSKPVRPSSGMKNTV